jgi:hypothetical protein
MFGDVWWDLGGEVELGDDGAIYVLARHRTGFAEDGASTQAFVLKLQP